MQKVTALGRYWASARMHLPRWAAPFAAVLVVLGATYGGGKIFLPFPYGSRLSTGPHESKDSTLKDGTKLHVGPDSELIVSYDRHDRLIDVRRGQFVVAVVKDRQARPFTIATAYGQIRALGTEFDVTYRPPGAAVISVSEGRVQVTPARKRADRVGIQDGIFVKAGESVTLANDGTVTAATTSPVTLEGELLKFYEAPIADMVARFNLRNEQKIYLHGDMAAAAADISITTSLAAHDPLAFANFLMTDVSRGAAVMDVSADAINVCDRLAARCPPASEDRGISRAR